VFPVEYENHLHIRSKAIHVTVRGGLYMFPVRYEHHLHINKSSYLRNRPWRPIGVFPVGYENHLHIKSKAFPVKDPEG
jgi:hypothetical protein